MELLVAPAVVAITWPVFYKQNPTIGTGLNAADFGVITRPDGSKQTTYKGWPLYYYINDSKAGDTNGDAVGNLWAIAKPDYTVMVANAQLVGLDSVKYNDQSLPGVGVSQYITDASGHTLYLFTHDTHATNTFTKADFSNNSKFPIDTVGNAANIPTILDKTQFSTIGVFGKTQLAYKGHPLYYFGQDGAQRRKHQRGECAYTGCGNLESQQCRNICFITTPPQGLLRCPKASALRPACKVANIQIARLLSKRAKFQGIVVSLLFLTIQSKAGISQDGKLFPFQGVPSRQHRITISFGLPY